MTDTPISAEQISHANQLAWTIWRRCAADARHGTGRQSVSSWLTGRGISPEGAWRAGFHFGLAPGPGRWHTVRPILDAWGVPPQVSEAAGLVRTSEKGTRYDGFRHRIIIPVHSPLQTGRRLLGFLGRRLDDSDPRAPKYLNSPTNTLYRKSEVLFGLAEGTDRLRQSAALPRAIVVCEGPLDAINVSATGPWIGLAPCGTALTAQQGAWITALSQVHDLPVVLAYDGDEAGAAASDKARTMLQPGLGERLQVAELPEGTDPGDLTADALADILPSAHTPGARR